MGIDIFEDLGIDPFAGPRHPVDVFADSGIAPPIQGADIFAELDVPISIDESMRAITGRPDQPYQFTPGERLASEMELARMQEPSLFEYIARRIPVFGTGFQLAEGALTLRAAKRIESGSASPLDYSLLADHVVEQERAGDRSFGRKVFDLATYIPGFATEFFLTAGAYSGGRKAAEVTARKVLGEAVERGAGKAATRTTGFLSGAAAQALANPARVAINVTDRLTDNFELTPDESGRLEFILRDDADGFVEALGKGYADSVIEYATERTGGLLGKIPVPSFMKGVKAAVTRRFLESGQGVGVMSSILQRAGWNGLLGEMFEERVGEVARGVTGLSDYGVTGDLFQGRTMPAAEKLAVEGLAFALFGGAARAADRMATRISPTEELGVEQMAAFSGAIRANPSLALELLNKDQPSRIDFETLGLDAGSASQRRQLVEMFRGTLEQLAQERPPTSRPVATTPQPAPAPTLPMPTAPAPRRPGGESPGPIVTPPGIATPPTAKAPDSGAARSGIDELLRSAGREQAGLEMSEALNELDQALSPTQLVRDFFKESYRTLPEQERRWVEQTLKRVTSFEPGLVMGVKSTGQEVVANTWEDIALEAVGQRPFSQIGPPEGEGWEAPLKGLLAFMAGRRKEAPVGAGVERAPLPRQTPTVDVLERAPTPRLARLAQELGVSQPYKMQRDALIAAIQEASAKQAQPARIEPFRIAQFQDAPPVRVERGSPTAIEAPGLEQAVAAEYAVVELDDLTPSHDFSTGRPRSNVEAGLYPEGLQPRDYRDPEEAAKVRRFAEEKKSGYFLSTHPGADSGPPSVTPSGVVVNGNARTMTLQLAAKKGFAWYTKELSKQAASFGIDPNVVEGMKRPVLVRLVDVDPGSAEAVRFARAGNVPTTQAQSPVRTAASLAGIIDAELLENMRLEEDTTFSEAVTSSQSGRKFRKSLEDALPAEQRAAFFNADGTLTDAGVELVRHMLLTKILPLELVERLGAEHKGLKRTLEGSVPQLLKLRRDHPGQDVTPQLVEALEFIVRNPDVTPAQVDDVLRQKSLFGGMQEELSPGGRMMLDFVMANAQKPRVFRQGMVRLLKDLATGSGLFAAELPEAPQMAAEALGVRRRPGARFGEKVRALRRRVKVPTSELSVPKRPLSANEIIATMERDFDVPIRLGRIRGSKHQLGIYKELAEVVRLQGAEAGNLGVAAHEVAHHLDKTTDVLKGLSKESRTELKNLDYEPDKQRTDEGFAEFVRLYLTTDDAPSAAPRFYLHFQRWLSRHPEQKASVGRARTLISHWRRQGAGSRIKAQISKTGKAPKPVGVPLATHLRERIGEISHRVYAAMKDEGHFLNLFQREAVRRGLKAKPGEGPYELFQAFTQAGPSFAHQAIESGVFTLTGEMEQIGPSLSQVFADILPGEYADFVSWMYARHALESWRQGKNPGISEEDAQLWFDQHDNPVWEKAARKFTALNDALVDMLADAGVISDASAEKIKNAYESYVPLLRVKGRWRARKAAGGKRLVNLPDPVKRRWGSGLQIIDPVQATVERAIRFYERAAQQQVIEATIEAAEKVEGMGGWIERVPPDLRKTTFPLQEVWPAISEKLEQAGIDQEMLEDVNTADLLNVYRPDYFYKGNEPIARVIRGGQQELYQFDPDLHAAISGMHYFQLPWMLDMFFGKATRLLKMGATGLSLSFGLRNPTRDYFTYLFQKKEAGDDVRGLVAPPAMMATYVYSQVQRLVGNEGDPTVRLWQRMAGELSQPLGLDRKSIRTAVSNAVGDSTARRLANIAKHPIEATRTAIGVSEVGPRLAEFRAVLEKHGFDRAALEAGKRPPRNVLVEAAGAAADVTVNFKRQGWLGKWLNRMIPFFNAPIEGADKFVRTWRDNPKRAAVASAMFASATAAYWMAVRDDDWYEEAPAWLKYGFWTLSDADGAPVVRIPRPHEWGWIISAGTEALLNTIRDRDPGELRRYAGQATKTILPDPHPSLVTPMVETAFNYDLFRDRPIVNERLQKLLPKDQVLPHTTLLARRMAAVAGVSPARLEHFLNETTGGLYRNVVKPVEGLLAGARFDAADLPAVGGFALRRDYSQSTDEFYALLDETERRYGSAKARGEVPRRLDEQARSLRETAEMMRLVRNIARTKESRLERFRLERYLIGLARHALGKEQLERYPVPWQKDESDLPPAVARIRDRWLGDKLWHVTGPNPDEHPDLVHRAATVLRDVSVDRDRAVELLNREAEQRGLKQRTPFKIGGGLGRTAYGERVQRLDKWFQENSR